MFDVLIMYFVYAVFLIGGGFMGMKKAKSKVSLISGVSTGAIALIIAVISHWQPIPALTMGLILAVALAIVFYVRFLMTSKAMPAIPMMIVSTLVAIASIVLIVLKR